MIFILQKTLIFTIPLLIVALAGMFAERSGIINIALDGIMIFGAFIGAVVTLLLRQNVPFFVDDACGCCCRFIILTSTFCICD